MRDPTFAVLWTLLPLLTMPALGTGCGDSAAHGDAAGGAVDGALDPPQIVDGVDAHGFLVVLAGVTQTGVYDHWGFGLVDPRTGASSDVIGGLFGTLEPWFEPFGVDPAGERMAWWDKEGGEVLLRVARVTSAGGTPGLEVQHSFVVVPDPALAVPEGPRFNTLGDRVYAVRTDEVLWANLDSGEIYTLRPTKHANSNRAQLAVSPDGRRAVVCNAVGEHCELYDDGSWDAPLATSRFVEWPGGELMSPDGQWALHAAPGQVGVPTKGIDAVHLPSRASRKLDVSKLQLATGELISANQAGQTMLLDGVPRFHPTGGLVARAAGVHGWVGSSSLTLGGVKDGSVFRPMRPEARLLMDAGATWDAGVFVAEAELPLGPRPRYLLYDTSAWASLGFSPDGLTEVVALAHAVAETGVGADVTALIHRETGEWTELWGGMSCATIGSDPRWWSLQGLEPGGFQCSTIEGAAPAAGLSPDGIWFQRQDYSYLLSADGRWSAGAAVPEEVGVGHLCLHPSVAPWETHCVALSGSLASPAGTFSETGVHNVGDLATAWVGYAAGPSPAAPVVMGASHRAAAPGTDVHVHGLGFGGTQGELHIGDVKVAGSSIDSWSDTRVVFTTGDALPDIGEVRVTSSGGASSSSARVFLARTEAWSPSTPLPGVGDGATLSIGDNVFGAPAALESAYVYDLVARADPHAVVVLATTLDSEGGEVTLNVPEGTAAGSYWLRVLSGDGVTQLVAVEVGPS